MKIKIRAFILLSLCFCLSSAYARTCGFFDDSTAQDQQISFGTISADNSSPIGTVIATTQTPAYSNAFGCKIDNTTTDYKYMGVFYTLALFTTVSSYGNGVYDTNIPGVGIKIYSTSSNRVFPLDFTQLATVFTFGQGAFTVQLIKTAASISGGQLSMGTLASIKAGGVVGATISLGQSSVVTKTCSLNNSNIEVSMGTINSSNFSGVGSTAGSKDFSVSLTCDANTAVNMTLNAGSSGAYSTDNGVLLLDASSGNTIANGIGLQVLYNDQPVALGSTFSVGSTNADGEFTIPLLARYYQTGSAVTAGVANASASFTITYQ